MDSTLLLIHFQFPIETNHYAVTLLVFYFFNPYNMNMADIIDLIGDKVLLKPDAVSDVLSSGLIVEKKSQEYPMEATVIALPEIALPGFTDPSKLLKVGDRVIFNPYAGDEIKYKGDDYRVVFVADIYGLIISSTPTHDAASKAFA